MRRYMTSTHGLRGRGMTQAPTCYPCPTCGAPPGQACELGKRIDRADDMGRLLDKDLPAFLEAQALANVAALKRLQPGHWLVMAVRQAEAAAKAEGRSLISRGDVVGS